jgi:methylenetetrahydrofolate reductase (NADPH)
MITTERPVAQARANTALDQRIESGKQVLMVELSPPQGGDPAPVRQAARALSGKAHAVALSDNRDRVAMSAMVAASLVAAEGVEAVLHLTTRDRNRAALISECLGAQALGVRNVLCTTGSHQTLGQFRAARNVFDIDPVLLLQALGNLEADASLVAEQGIAGAGPFCLGAAVSPNADPLELQVMRLGKKIRAGARYLVTDPIFDLERFNAWWAAVTSRGLHEKAAILAGIRPLLSADEARQLAQRHPTPRIPAALVDRMSSKSTSAAQRAEGIQIAQETIARLASIKGLRGFAIVAEGEAAMAVEVLEKAGLKA